MLKTLTAKSHTLKSAKHRSKLAALPDSGKIVQATMNKL
jgi:hypothetical protein